MKVQAIKSLHHFKSRSNTRITLLKCNNLKGHNVSAIDTSAHNKMQLWVANQGRL